MSRIHTICNIKTIRFHCFQCSHPTFFSFSRFFLSVLSANVTDASFRKPCEHHFEHVCKVFLNTWLFSVKLSRIIFIVIPCITKQICRFTRVLFVILFASLIILRKESPGVQNGQIFVWLLFKKNTLYYC